MECEDCDFHPDCPFDVCFYEDAFYEDEDEDENDDSEWEQGCF